MACIAPLFTTTMTAKRQHAKIYIRFYPPQSIGGDSEIILEGMHVLQKYISATPARMDV